MGNRAIRLVTARTPCDRAVASGPRSPRRRTRDPPVGAARGVERCAGTFGAEAVVVLMVVAPAASDGELLIALQPAVVEGGEDGQDRQEQHAVRGGLRELPRLLPEAQAV